MHLVVIEQYTNGSGWRTPAGNGRWMMAEKFRASGRCERRARWNNCIVGFGGKAIGTDGEAASRLSKETDTFKTLPRNSSIAILKLKSTLPLLCLSPRQPTISPASIHHVWGTTPPKSPRPSPADGKNPLLTAQRHGRGDDGGRSQVEYLIR